MNHLTLYFSAVSSPENIFSLRRESSAGKISADAISVVQVDLEEKNGVVTDVHAIIVEPRVRKEIEYFHPGIGYDQEFLLPGGSFVDISDTAGLTRLFEWLKADIITGIVARIEHYCGVGKKLCTIPEECGMLPA